MEGKRTVRDEWEWPWVVPRKKYTVAILSLVHQLSRSCFHLTRVLMFLYSYLIKDPRERSITITYVK